MSTVKKLQADCVNLNNEVQRLRHALQCAKASLAEIYMNVNEEERDTIARQAFQLVRNTLEVK